MPLSSELLAAECWTELLEKDDRNSPAEYPEMCLITLDELADFMNAARQDERAKLAAPLPEEEMRERIAREIDPELDHHIANATWAKCRALTAAAYAKADSILALFAEERAKVQGEVEGAHADAERCFQALEGRDQKIIQLEERIVALTCDVQAAEADLSKSQASFEEAVRCFQEIADGRLTNHQNAHYLAHRNAVKAARSFLLKHGETK